MKPTSIIFLIVSVLLIIAGAVTCKFAEGFAKGDGTTLIHPEETDMVFTHDFSREQIKTIKLVLKDAEVNICKDAEETYIELINFPSGSYEFSSSHPTLTVVNDWEGFTLSGTASFVSNINGLCGLINYHNFADAKKVVNIHIAEDSSVKDISCKLDTGVLNLDNWHNMSINYDPDINNGEVYLNGVLDKTYIDGEPEWARENAD